MVILTLIPMLLSALYMIANQLGLTKKAEDMVLEVEAASVMDRKMFPISSQLLMTSRGMMANAMCHYRRNWRIHRRGGRDSQELSLIHISEPTRPY